MYRPKTANSRNEEEMITKAKRELSLATDPVDKIRLLCLLRGSSGILGFGSVFRRMDDDGSKTLSFEEFSKGITETGLPLSNDELKEVFKRFDRDQNGTINFDEFLLGVRPPLNANRLKLIDMAYTKMDNTGDGVVNLDDLKKVYNVKNNPKYLSGEESEDQILTKYLANFEKHGSVDGCLTKQEFIDYYAGVSASIDNDGYFDLMMRNSWKI